MASFLCFGKALIWMNKPIAKGANGNTNFETELVDGITVPLAVDEVALFSNTLHSIFSKCDFTIKHEIVHTSSNINAKRAFIEAKLSHTQGCAISKLVEEGNIPETSIQDQHHTRQSWTQSRSESTERWQWTYFGLWLVSDSQLLSSNIFDTQEKRISSVKHCRWFRVYSQNLQYLRVGSLFCRSRNITCQFAAVFTEVDCYTQFLSSAKQSNCDSNQTKQNYSQGKFRRRTNRTKGSCFLCPINYYSSSWANALQEFAGHSLKPVRITLNKALLQNKTQGQTGECITR